MYIIAINEVSRLKESNLIITVSKLMMKCVVMY